MIVNQQVKVPFSIRTYKDEVNCDIVPMEAGHILLGRPWQFDRKIIYNGLTNEITLTHLSTKFVLHPQTTSQVAKDQLTMKDKRDECQSLHKTNFCIDIIFQSLYSSTIYGYFVVIFVNKSYLWLTLSLEHFHWSNGHILETTLSIKQNLFTKNH